MDWWVVLWTLAIFLSRVADVALGTIRVQLIIRQRKLLAALISFVEIVIYIVVVSKVIQDIATHWHYVIAYAGGFAVGTVVGIALSGRMARGALEATIISHDEGAKVEAALREAGFGLTRYAGLGREGEVVVLSAVCAAKNLPRLLLVVSQADANAFVYTQELTDLRGGYVYGVKGKL